MKKINGWQSAFIIVAIFLVSINLRPAVTSVGPLLNTIQADLGISSTMMSLLTSIPVFCMGLFAPLAVPFNKLLGYKWSINLLLIGIGIATGARLFFTGFGALIGTSFIAGLCIAIISPMLNAYIKEKFAHNMGPVIGVYSLAMGFGAMISAGFTGVFYERFQNSWPAALSIWGVLAFIAIIVWHIAIPEKRPAEVKVQNQQTGRNPWKLKTTWIIMLFFGIQTSLFFSLTTWLSPIAMEQGMGLVVAGSVITVMSIVQMIGNIVIPSLLNKFPNTSLWLKGLTVIAAIGTAFLFINAQWSIWVAAVILGIALSGLFPIGLLLPLQESQNDAEANSFSSMVLSGAFMMSAVVPLLIGIVYDAAGTHFISKWLLVVLCVLMYISIMMYESNKRRV